MAKKMAENKDQDVRPVPDPTNLTTQQLMREITVVRQLIDERDRATRESIGNVIESRHREIQCLREILETRFDGMDRAVQLLQNIAEKLPVLVDEKIASLAGIHEEKFSSIQTQFRERDTRAEQTTKDGKTAVDAALQAAKEAVGKSETATVKQIDQQGSLITSATKALDDKIADTKDRLTRLEGKGEGGHSVVGYVFAGIGALAAIIGIIAWVLSTR